MPTIFIPNPDFARELLSGSNDVLRATLEDLTQEAEDLYRDSVPIAVGDLEASVFSAVGTNEDGELVGRVGAKDWKAALIELGTINREPDGSLRRAVEALGLELADGEIGIGPAER